MGEGIRNGRLKENVAVEGRRNGGTPPQPRLGEPGCGCCDLRRAGYEVCRMRCRAAPVCRAVYQWGDSSSGPVQRTDFALTQGRIDRHYNKRQPGRRHEVAKVFPGQRYVDRGGGVKFREARR